MTPALVFFAIIVVSVYLITECYHALRRIKKYDKVWELFENKKKVDSKILREG